MTQIQIFLQIDAPRPFVITRPDFMPEPHVDTGDAVAKERFGDLLDACLNRSILARSVQFEIVNWTGDQTNKADTSNRHPIFVDPLLHELPPLLRH